MSVFNKLKCFLFCFLFAVCGNLWAVSISFIEGAVPVGSPAEMVEDGIRVGNSLLLKRAWGCYAGAAADNSAKAAYLELGRIYFHLSLLGQSTQQQHDTARSLACKAVAKHPKSSDAHRALGLVLAGEGAFLDAYQELTLALYLNPANEFLIYDLAVLHVALREPEKALDYLSGARRRGAWPYVIAAMANVQMNNRGKAIINLYKARYLGFSDAMLETMLEQLTGDLEIELWLK